MNNQQGARLNLNRAEVILEEARGLNAKGVWNLVVRRSQEAVELALKGVLLWAGLEVPKVHDVGATLRQNTNRFPSEFTQIIPKLVSISRSLRAEREISFYGDEESGLPPEMLYSDEDAGEALDRAEFVLESCRTLIEGENSLRKP